MEPVIEDGIALFFYFFIFLLFAIESVLCGTY